MALDPNRGRFPDHKELVTSLRLNRYRNTMFGRANFTGDNIGDFSGGEDGSAKRHNGSPILACRWRNIEPCFNTMQAYN
ncbi:TPA: hypothetical protein ACX15R_005495 [Pseudomonas aeruginosa]